MSIKTQKIIKYIPILNIILLHYFSILRSQKRIKFRTILKDFIIMALVLSAAFVSYLLLSIYLFQTVHSIAVLIFMHFLFFWLGCITIKAEELAIAEENKAESNKA